VALFPFDMAGSGVADFSSISVLPPSAISCNGMAPEFWNYWVWLKKAGAPWSLICWGIKPMI